MMRAGLSPNPNPNPNQYAAGRKTIPPRLNNTARRGASCNLFTVVTRGLVVLFVLYIVLVIRYEHKEEDHHPKIKKSPIGDIPDHDITMNQKNRINNKASSIRKPTAASSNASCAFRKYPPSRYYGWKKKPMPDFLESVEYIYGEIPILLATSNEPAPSLKLCVDQSEWYSNDSRLPFADGTNPSILRLHDNPRIDPNTVARQHLPTDAYYLATICMTNSQCSWKESVLEKREYNLSALNQPATVRTILLVLNQNFETLQEATISTVMDADFGKIKMDKTAHKVETNFFALDDARLFTHQGEIWVSYREGPNFGYEDQVLNKLHFSHSSEEEENKLSVELLASETETLCCGRNMALLDNVHTNALQALTWVDPITVVDVELKKNSRPAARTAGRRRRLQESRPRKGRRRLQELESHHHRRLDEKQKKKESHFHGTNGFMVHLPASNEYLGIGHFHRPPGRKRNPYARFGHHYTHAFFTIPDEPPYFLKRLSPELLLPSHAYPEDDAEIIQFWSGLELANSNGSTLALAYGINDCEGAATYIDMTTVNSLLRDVPQGKEVVDLMELLHKTSRS